MHVCWFRKTSLKILIRISNLGKHPLFKIRCGNRLWDDSECLQIWVMPPMMASFRKRYCLWGIDQDRQTKQSPTCVWMLLTKVLIFYFSVNKRNSNQTLKNTNSITWIDIRWKWNVVAIASHIWCFFGPHISDQSWHDLEKRPSWPTSQTDFCGMFHEAVV